MNKDEGKVSTVVGKEIVRVRGDTRESLRVSFLNIGLVEGSVRAIRSKEFSVSSELSDRLGRRERREKKVSIRVI